MTQEEVLNSDLVKNHGIETAIWILANAHKNLALLAKMRLNRLEELESKHIDTNLLEDAADTIEELLARIKELESK